MRLSAAATVADYRRIARRRLPHFLFEYIDGAAGTEITARRNRHDMQATRLHQRVMRDVDTISTECRVLGRTLSMPVILGPVGMAGVYARRGEAQAAAAARDAGIPFCLSTLGICTLAEVKDAVGETPWFQLYMIRDRGFMAAMLGEAARLGSPVLVFTVDVAAPGIRHRDHDSGLTGGVWRQAWQAARRPRWSRNVVLRGRPLTFGSIAPALQGARTLGDFWGWLGANLDSSVTWDDLAFVRRHWPGPIVAKGILHADDARAALAAGADGVIVSNHGGRQLDGVRSTIGALPAVAEAVDGAVPVLLDGGVYSGIDVMRALAAGADACLLGRAWAFALAAGGEAGIAQLLAGIRREFVNTMAMTGCRTLAEIGPQLIDRD